MAAKSPPRPVTVLASTMVTPAMLRLTLGGEGMRDFPPRQQGGYVKLMFAPQPGKTKPTVRTYTIRHQRDGEIDEDFALHGTDAASAGPATGWATSVTGGEGIVIGGPGAAKPLPEGRDFYLVAGDMTGLPAISVNLEALPRDAKGVALIEVQSEADCQSLDAPAGVEIRWLVNPAPGTRPELLEQAVRGVEWPAGSPYGWVACEFSAMQRLRQYLRVERGLGPSELYISSYWKCGLVEDDHKIAKRADAEASAG